MALQLNIDNSDVGAGFSAAYAKVSHVRVVNRNGDDIKVDVLVDVYASESARESDSIAVANWHFTIPMPTGDFLPAIYNALKEMPEFAGAIDC